MESNPTARRRTPRHRFEDEAGTGPTALPRHRIEPRPTAGRKRQPSRTPAPGTSTARAAFGLRIAWSAWSLQRGSPGAARASFSASIGAMKKSRSLDRQSTERQVAAVVTGRWAARRYRTDRPQLPPPQDQSPSGVAAMTTVALNTGRRAARPRPASHRSRANERATSLWKPGLEPLERGVEAPLLRSRSRRRSAPWIGAPCNRPAGGRSGRLALVSRGLREELAFDRWCRRASAGTGYPARVPPSAGSTTYAST